MSAWLIELAELARMLKVSPDRIRQLAQTGDLERWRRVVQTGGIE